MCRVRSVLRLIMSNTRPGVPETACTPFSSLRMSSPACKRIAHESVCTWVCASVRMRPHAHVSTFAHECAHALTHLPACTHSTVASSSTRSAANSTWSVHCAYRNARATLARFDTQARTRGSSHVCNLSVCCSTTCLNKGAGPKESKKLQLYANGPARLNHSSCTT